MEYEKVGEALVRWLDSQQVSAADSVKAMLAASGAMIAARATSFEDLLEGLMHSTTALQAEAISAYLNRTWQTIR